MTLKLQMVDWLWIASFLGLSIIIGAYSYFKSNESVSDFFLCERKMPWWLLGFSMVATTFSTDTPNLVTNLVREQGIRSNWVWWSSLLTGMLTVFLRVLRAFVEKTNPGGPSWKKFYQKAIDAI